MYMSAFNHPLHDASLLCNIVDIAGWTVVVAELCVLLFVCMIVAFVYTPHCI